MKWKTIKKTFLTAEMEIEWSKQKRKETKAMVLKGNVYAI